MRASGTSETIEARVSDLTVNVDPITDAASDLITNITNDLSSISTDEVDSIVSEIDELSSDIDDTGLSAEALSTAIQTEASNNEETNNIINSTASTGQICGTVTNSTATGLENVVVVARDFGNWVTRAKTKTDSNGDYCLNVPKEGDANPDTGGTFTGEYILGAMNRVGDTLDPNRSATEWWSTTGDAYNQFDADKVSVPDTNLVSKDFQLADGARIHGTVYVSGTTTPIEGAKVIIRDFEAYTPVASARVKADGTYRVNVISGDYFVEVRYRTIQPYASEVYDGSTGSHIRNMASKITVSAGDARNINFELDSGYLLSGTVSEGVGGPAVSGVRVMVNIASGGAGARLRTNKQGNYRVWLKPDTYNVTSYGQNTSVDMTASNGRADFTSAAINKITATFQDSSGNPVSQVKVSAANSSGSRVNLELPSSDGSIELYTPDTGNHYFAAVVDDLKPYASTILTDQIEEQNATPFVINAGDNNIGTVTLPDAGWLTGFVSSDGTTGIGNVRVQVRSNGGAGTNKFVTTRTRGDGSYYLSLPAGSYSRVRILDFTTGTGNCDTVIIIAGQETTVDYNDGTGACTITDATP